jgi:hypothetical protein
MGYEKRYDMESIAGRNEAVRDFEEYVGERRAELLANAIKSGEVKTMDQFRFLASFCGVQGAPVVAFAERHGLYE